MHELAAAKNIRFIVVLIPTKEAVFDRLWERPSMNYRNLAKNEAQVWIMTKDFLARNGVEYLDSLPALQEQFAKGIQPYRVTHDEHPNEKGHKAIARLVVGHLNSPKTLQ